MRHPIEVTKLPGHGTGKVGRIHVSVGDEVAKGDLVLEIEADKGASKIEADRAGAVASIEVATGDSVSVGQLVATLEVVEEAASPKDKPAAATSTGASKDKGAGLSYFASVMKPKEEKLSVDLTVVGAGPGGYVAALKAAQEGLSVALVEREKVGGTCLNWGCIPTKALVRSATLFHTMCHAELFGLSATGVSCDMKAIIARKDAIVAELVGGIEYLLEKQGVRVVRGEGTVQRPGFVTVSAKRAKTEIESKNIIIATGSCSSELPIEGAGLAGVLDSKSALDLTELPRELAIIGGGVIGMEFAFIYAALGVDVTVVEFLDSVLATLEPEAIEEIMRQAESLGIHMHTGTCVRTIRQAEDRRYVLVCEHADEERYLIAERVLVAVGRSPVLDASALELGLKLGPKDRSIAVDEHMRTNVEGIYAIGDVTDKIQLAHVASHQGIVAVENIVGGDVTMNYDAVPSAIFTSPEIATVGLTEAQAKSRGHEVAVGTFPFAANGKALALGERDGFVKLVCDAEDDIVLGGTIVGPHASDLIHEVTVAVTHGLTATALSHTIHAHPTTSEAIHEAALATHGRALHHV